MSFWTNVLIVLHVLSALGIIGLVLLQHGKGADMGSGFGGGASGSLFGATGSANFLSRTTAALAVIFFLTTFALAYIASHRPRSAGGVMDAVREQPGAPPSAVPAPQAAPDAAKAGEGAGSKANEVPK